MWIRAGAYGLFAALLAQLSFIEARTQAGLERFTEFGIVETSQAALLALMALALFLAARRKDAPLLDCMALLFTVLLIRENDQLLELWLPHGAWKWPAAAGVVFAAGLFFRHRARVLDQLVSLSRTPAFGVLLSGFAALVFSRLFGRGEFWEAVMEERYWRTVKNAAEEGVELFALGMLAAGVTETLLQRRRDRD